MAFFCNTCGGRCHCGETPREAYTPYAGLDFSAELSAPLSEEEVAAWAATLNKIVARRAAVKAKHPATYAGTVVDAEASATTIWIGPPQKGPALPWRVEPPRRFTCQGWQVVTGAARAQCVAMAEKAVAEAGL
jgi:hypothetical protein